VLGHGARGADHAVQLGEIAGDAGHLAGQRVEFLRQPTDNGPVRFGHAGHDAGRGPEMDE
jgi:hypothetical protein